MFLLLYVSTSFGQQPIFQWAAQFGSSVISDTWNDNGRSVAVDQQGNVYSAGLFFHDVDFDPGPGTFMMTAQGPFDEAIYISKLSPTGQFIWAEQIPTEISGPIYLTVDHHNNIYLTSYVSGPVDMDPGPGINNGQMIGRQDAFLLKLDQNGNLLWEKQFGGAGANNGAAGYAVDVDQNDNVILTGSFYGTIDVDPGSGTTLLTGLGSSTVFLVKLTSGGNFLWGTQVGGTGSVYGYVDAEDIKSDGSGNIFATGWFGGSCDFDVRGSHTNLTSGGPADGFICKFDGNGNFLWVKSLGSSVANNVIQPRGIDVDETGDVYSSGSFIGTQDFDPSGNTYNLVSNGSFDAFLVKLNPQGDFLWAKNLGSSDVDYAYDVCVTPLGNVFMIGGYNKTVDFDPGPGTSTISNLYDWSVITKFDADGNFIFAAPFSGYCTSRRIVTDPVENIYVTGGFGGTVDFDPGPGVFRFSEGRGWIDAFVVKLSKCLNATASSLLINSCEAYTLNNHRYDSSGTYVQVIPNSTGCDSVITMKLTINKKFTAQTKTICQGQTFYAGGSNQAKAGTYIDTLHTITGCDSIVTTSLFVNLNPMPDLGNDKILCQGNSISISPGVFSSYSWQDGASQNKITVNRSGSYWVTVSNSNNCIATDTIKITSVQPPRNFLNAIDSVCSYESLTLAPTQNFSSYLWSTGESQRNISVQSPGVYWLKVSDQYGCSGLDTITVAPKQCMESFYIPTAFSPNGDGKNELFHPLIFGKIVNYHFTVYTRWGQVIFQAVEPKKAWDGTLAGVLQDPAVYIWTCTYQLEGKSVKSEKGTVVLVR
jgi:gliding motility-associated-like protein